MKIVVDNKIPFIKEKIEQLADEVVYLPGSEISPADVRDAEILIVRTRTRCNAALLRGSSVRLIVTATIGYDHLDTAFLAEAGIAWTNCPGCNASSVRQYVHNVLVALGCTASPATVGIVGVGHVGSLVADDLRRMGLEVRVNDPLLYGPEGGERMSVLTPLQESFLPCSVSLDSIREECDIVTFHTYLSTEGPYPTYHLADKAFFRSLRRRPLLINTSRGEVVDNESLLCALREGRISDAVIDTWEHEPHILPELLERVAIGTPHIAGYAADGKANATRMSLEAVCRYLGRPFSFEVTPPALPEGFSYGPLAHEGVLRLYDPRIDSERLKQHPERFEQLRGDYPLRREHE